MTANCAPDEIRTRVLALRGPRPGPLDNGGEQGEHSTIRGSDGQTKARWLSTIAFHSISQLIPLRGMMNTPLLPRFLHLEKM